VINYYEPVNFTATDKMITSLPSQQQEKGLTEPFSKFITEY